jgi:hypothetical protein
MLAINWPRAYNVTCGHGNVRVDQSRRPPRTASFSVVPDAATGAFLSLDGVTEFPLIFATLTEASAIPKVDQQIRDTIASLVADGYNAIRMGASTGRTWTEGASNWGCWTYTDSDPSYTNRWVMEEAALVQFDKMVAWSLDAGIECLYMSDEGYDDIINRHPNQRPQGTYQGRGMCWSSEYDEMAWDVNSRIYLRTSTVTGIRHCDNGRIIWGCSNENGFSDAYQRTTTSSWGGGGSVRWFSKIIDSVTDSYGNNGYWRTELAAKWVAWVTASSYSASVGVNGSGGTWNGCIPTPSAFTALSTDSADKNAVLDFMAQMDIEHVQRVIYAYQSARSDVCIMLGTWSYSSMLAWTEHGRTGNFLVDTHHYYIDDASSGVKTGSVVSRRSVFNSAWSYVTNGLGEADATVGQRTENLAYIATEEGQYGPSGWRYERVAISALISCRHKHSIGPFGWAQQVTTDQLLNDGKNMPNDHANVGSQCSRLMIRCIHPIVRYRFFSPASGLFTVMATPQSVKDKSHTNGANGFVPNRFNPSAVSDGTENSAWGSKCVLLSIDAGNTPTTDWTNYPKVTDGTLAAGTYVINTADEKIHIRNDHGIQAMSPYCNWFIGEMLASPVFSMPLSISNLAAAITRAHLCIRSEGPWPLFEGPWMMFVHGSDYSLDLVRRGSDYTLDGPGNVTEAGWLSNSDSRTLYYVSAGSQSWSNGTISDQRLMMPETFTIALDTSAATGVFDSLEQEVFKIGNDGLPVRVATSFSSGVTSWAYDATCPVYYGQPINKRNTDGRRRKK